MKLFSSGQLNRASEILGNLAIVWFSGSIISPLFTVSKSLAEIITFISIGLIVSILLTIASLSLVKEIKL